ncbi:glycine/D-amino acid oxidase-like deaminating enzyme [Pseudochelatococcus lubricantis]|uniref:Glycine/D-amino acid oxidase-like deaminating enzyme n=1 Tax=Pseudochelatococcus lubricantis TaxID=1538102 RepID=A0ABX0UTE1_9HYPH|nr:FAD-binding oxidoreductase [Pseudochelatococcus lubricantis]NIJ56228.1 glycine/D-amino acid oxidase-like deaminating enzyme [Pseudochelatococcus lubricantis]
MAHSIFAPDYVAEPYWWQAFRPHNGSTDPLPQVADAVVVGGGYAGICCATELAAGGRDVAVLDAGPLGGGASSRSGGQVTGGVNIQKKANQAMAGNRSPEAQRLLERRLSDASASYRWLKEVITGDGIDCDYVQNGRLTALWAADHFAAWKARLPQLNSLTDSDAVMLTRDELAAELGTTAYHGAAFIRNAGHLNPSAFYGGLLRRAMAQGVRGWGGVQVTAVKRTTDGFTVQTPRGEIRCGQVVLALNGSSGQLDAELARSVVPVTSHMIATEPLPEGLAREIIRNDRAVSESRRVVNHYRLSGDGQRLVFGGRARFTPTSEETTARLLHQMMVQRYPRLAGVKITHSWGGDVSMTLDYMPHIGGREGLHWVFGCNGSGVTMMSWLGHMLGRKLREGVNEPVCAFDGQPLPRHALYYGNPWFMFALGSYYQMLDAMDHRRSKPEQGTR